ncbi:response regulator transcription factor [Ferruginibacter sp. HRS2-29]|uniref:response regulator n=1 Tax=Ferruginibacter sp. HRS2-29 TaxID=2487334 RepID=UPI0020CFD124|nr:response regulator transcription factor [Ferruginibacter sp. HRS2-29]MCP9749653.1 DNA-binding response regulator [Ferruginibacter sp. HRS2-29]
MKTFLLIDDHTIVRSGTKNMLKELYLSCEVYEAANDREAIDLLEERAYDLVMMDIQIPGADMPALMKYIHLNYPLTNVLMFSMSAEKIFALQFIRAGANGFLPKESPLGEIHRAIDMVLTGRTYMSSSLAETLVSASFSQKPLNSFEKLSARELEIAELLLSGEALKDIAKTLNLHPSTVGTHKLRIFEKLAITSLLELKEHAANHRPGESKI